MRVVAGIVVIAAMADGERGLCGRDRVSLPAPARHAVGIQCGDLVLLAGEPGDGVLVVYRLASLDAMLNALPDPAGRGDTA
jgi:hypothetical protein